MVKTTMKTIQGLLLAAATAIPGPAGTSFIDGVAIEYGVSASALSHLRLNRIAVQRSWERRWFEKGAVHIGGYWDASLGYWDNESIDPSHDHIFDLALTPTFRLEGNEPGRIAPYIEAGIGAHFLSHSSVNQRRRFGSAFQFGDHVGFGARFGPDLRFDLSYRFQHLSNGGLQPPNRGINYNQVRLGLHF